MVLVALVLGCDGGAGYERTRPKVRVVSYPVGTVPKVPLRLTGSLSAPERRAVAAAAEAWNESLSGCVQLELSRERGVPVVARDLRQRGARGRYDPHIPELVIGSRFVEDNGMPFEAAYRVALHELGHVLGVRHFARPGCATSERGGSQTLCSDEVAVAKRRWVCR